MNSPTTNPPPATDRRHPGAAPAGRGERALLVQVRFGTEDLDADLEELRLLAVSAGAAVVGQVAGARERPDAATFIGKGKAEEVREAVLALQAELVLVNHELSPTQERNLEKIVGCRVLNRTGLILDIFAQRARSHEGKLQVELAQLEHLSTRLVRGWTHLERQRGGIGLRGGPGETQIEIDRRLLRERMKTLNRQLEKVRGQREGRRKARRKIPVPTVSLVGYTNAGKSTLFNRLTGAGVYAADQLFATLDPTMRAIVLPGDVRVILSDTVGFIRHLPHNLVEAFKSTLEEVSEADLLLHVVDAANPERREQAEQVDLVLAEIGAAQILQIRVQNKIDLTGETPQIERDGQGDIAQVSVSAASGAGIDLLLAAIAEHFRRTRVVTPLRLPPVAGRLRALIYEHLHVLREEMDEEGCALLEIESSPENLAWLRHQPDFRDEYIAVTVADVLAPTGS